MDIASKYESKEVEKKWKEIWVAENAAFADVNDNKPSFSMVIPPPNITGNLHIGHAFNITLQDITARYKKMRGFNVLWIPGTDHAGIATQNVVEKELAKKGKTKEDIGRENFTNIVWEWKEKYGGTIIEQIKHIGASCDWTRLRFTMDEGLSSAVIKVFVDLYNEGLIYRGNYIINWCPRCKTALSDLEVEHQDKKGSLYYIKYPLKDKKDSFITVATTRPETMLGDTAVAVNPDDSRYKKFVGKILILPLVNREIPVIAESRVDSSFGTGAVKVTPAHDINDFEIGKIHKLPSINIMEKDGTMNKEAGKYKGLDRFKCREEVLKDLQKAGLLEKIDEHLLSIGNCHRCSTIVEPMVSLQWFVKMKSLAEEAKDAVTQGKVKFISERWEKNYLNWIDNIRDWCISRQIWWGHRLPVWYCEQCSEIHVEKSAPKQCKKCKHSKLRQDEDVLDTWFSSALWPFSTLGWPEKTKELEKFYPTSVLITGFDIIFFWVARMVMMGLKFTGKEPFNQVYITGLVRDAEGKKMSKSKGNVVDPLELTEKFGVDAVRFTLASISGADPSLSPERIEGYRNFLNKIWNAARFIFMNTQDFDSTKFDISKANLTLADKWILHRLNLIINSLNSYMDNYRFDEASSVIYDFIWKEYCDWYIEFAKPKLKSEVKEEKQITQYILKHVFYNSLKLLHPFTPFITEELYQYIPEKKEKNIVKDSWPKEEASFANEQAEKDMNEITEIIRAVRNIRSEMNISPAKKTDVLIKVLNERSEKLIKENTHYITELLKIENFKFSMQIDKPKGAVATILKNEEIYVPLAEIMDLNKEVSKLTEEVKSLSGKIEALDRRLSSEEFIKKAPELIIAGEKAKKEEYIQKKSRLEENIKNLS